MGVVIRNIKTVIVPSVTAWVADQALRCVAGWAVFGLGIAGFIADQQGRVRLSDLADEMIWKIKDEFLAS